MSTETLSHCQLPVELIERVIQTVWEMPLSQQERIILMSSSVLVNKSWSTLFSQVAFKDVHIPSLGYSRYFHEILDSHSIIFRPSTHHMPREHCVTLTIHQTPTVRSHTISKRSKLHQSYSPSPLDILDWITDIAYLPSLRKINIHYLDHEYTDIFENMRLATFPAQVTHLNVHYSFSTVIDDLAMREMQKLLFQHRADGLPLEHIEHLGVFGADSVPVLAFLMLNCPSLASVDLDMRPEGKWNQDDRDYMGSLRTFCSEKHLQLTINTH